MNMTEFELSLQDDQPPRGLPPPVEALWWDAKQAWDKAHAKVQDEDGRDAASEVSFRGERRNHRHTA